MPRWSLLTVLLVAACIESNPDYVGLGTDEVTGSTASNDGGGTDETGSTPGSTGSNGTGTTDTTGPCVNDPNWWNESWQYRRKLTFDNAAQAEDLQDFTVRVALDGNFEYGHAEGDGADVRFIDDDGTTELPYHIESWNPGGESDIWVRVDTIDGGSSTDHVWVYYGSPGAQGAQDAQATYDANYAGVWHLSESAGEHVDSATGMSCSWTGGGAGTQDAVGRIAGANQFDDDAVDCGSDQIGNPTYSTITAWVNLPLTGDANQEVVCVESTSSPYQGLALYVRRSDGAVGKWLGSTYHYGDDPASKIAADEWSFIAIRAYRDNANGWVSVSKNGGPWEEIISGDTGDLTVPGGTSLMLGMWPGGGPGANVRGRVDEVQISLVERSDDWVRARHASGSNSFITYGGEEALCP
jgi:hypothetical protein